MKLLFYDCFSGISGDMNLGAMIDLGIDQTYLVDELNKILEENYNQQLKKKYKGLCGILGGKGASANAAAIIVGEGKQ